MFANLFDKVPAKRAGNDEDIAGAVMYLASRAGVSYLFLFTLPDSFSERVLIVALVLREWNITCGGWWQDIASQWAAIANSGVEMLSALILGQGNKQFRQIVVMTRF